MADINNIKPPLQPDINSPRSNVAERNNRTSQTTPGIDTQASTGTDKVSLSDTLSQLEQSLADVPVADSNKVAAVKKAIEDGSYQIDSQELARKMIDFEGDL